MRVLSYLRMEIDPDQIASYERDLEEMLQPPREDVLLSLIFSQASAAQKAPVSIRSQLLIRVSESA